MRLQEICHTYQQNIQREHAQIDATVELSLHTHLKKFLEETATSLGHNILIIHEPRKLTVGRPDFVVKRGALPLGYIEAEAYEKELDALTGHNKEQNKRFVENLDNFILTNFVEFRLYTEGQLRRTAKFTDADSLEILLNRFLSANVVAIRTPEALAKHLARRTRELKTQLAMTLTEQNSSIYRMFAAFKKLLLSTLTPDKFADMYAQTLAYGLFAARCTLPNATNFSRLTANDALPRSNPFLRQLFHHVASPNLEENVTYILDDIATLLRSVQTEMLRTAFATSTGMQEPIIHFYETFLAEYEPELRKKLGVYYTPTQVISYIVRSVDMLLKTKLNRTDGLADENTLILDPATGTGGFLLAVLNHIRVHMTTKYGTAEWHQYLNDKKLVGQLFGFEILVAPYTIAHLKLSLFLQEQGYQQTTERIRVYLTNTLDAPLEKEQYTFAAFISDEANAAVSVKQDVPLLVILGNPPYSRDSANPSRKNSAELTFIGELIEHYKQVDGQPLGEANLKALQADYVKFIRWAQWRIDKNGEGVIGYIVNNSFLDGTTSRGMRKSLLDSFNAIYLLNLHGSLIRKEAIPDGETDENVFDIKLGVSILLCVKEPNNSAPAKIYYADMWGSRSEKYKTLAKTDVENTNWCELHPTSPHYLFVPQATKGYVSYNTGWPISNIFKTHSTGIVTGRDKLTLHHTAEKVKEIVADFASLAEVEARKRYKLRKDSRDWKIRLAQADIRKHPDVERYIAQIRYRPFDTRWTYYTGQARGFICRPRSAVMRHLLAKNLALCVCRTASRAVWQHALVTDKIIETHYFSSESAHVFPLYLYRNPNALGFVNERELNLSQDFLKAVSEGLLLPQTSPSGLPQGVSGETILAYIYAILYSPTYRRRYYEFLKYDFPRIPLPRDIEQFQNLAALGTELMNWHLMRDVQIPPRHRFEGEGKGIVSTANYTDGCIWINQTQYFTDVAASVWNYQVGAYQVCKKWLQDKKGEMLSHAEVRHYRAILVAVTETLKIVGEIDSATVNFGF